MNQAVSKIKLSNFNEFNSTRFTFKTKENIFIKTLYNKNQSNFKYILCVYAF